jgi:RNA 2',3'-cyclic 3'-phosphodiesterase
MLDATAMPEPNRLFFALAPPPEVRSRAAAVAKALRSEHRLGGRLRKPERYHMTLYFLGDHISAATEAAALQAAESVAAPAFHLRLDQAGSFRNREIPVWLGAGEMPAELAHLEQALRQALAQLAQERQPRFVPHLTVLREAERPLRVTAIEPIDWPVTDFVLIRSILHRQPAEYITMARFPLRGTSLPPPKQGSLF